MQDLNYVLKVIDKVSIRPSKISITKEVYKKYYDTSNMYVNETSIKSDCKNNSSNNKIQRKFHNFNISNNSQRKLSEYVEFLYHFAKSRRVITYNKKVIHKFKIAFLTLTLPSTQIHPSSEIVSECLYPFLNTLRKRLKMNNYIYRLEWQANGNIHIHLITDTYIDYYFAKRHWNKAINKLGYVDEYSSNMKKLNYTDYVKKYGKNYKGEQIQSSVLWDRYNSGIKSNWRNPNSVDVRNATDNNSINSYISKYLSKKEKSAKCNKLDNEENSFALRLCYWSRSLSRLKIESMPIDYYSERLIEWISKDASSVIRIYDYCKVIYYDIKLISKSLKEWLLNFFNEIRADALYVPAG